MAWEKPVPHHKWKDELDEEKRVKEAKKEAKAHAKAEDHSKRCPFCGMEELEQVHGLHPGLAPDDPDQVLFENTYHCNGCVRLYRVNCPGTILLDGNPVIVQHSEQDE